MEFQVNMCEECKFEKKCEAYRKLKKRVKKTQRKLFSEGYNLTMGIVTSECDKFVDIAEEDNVLDSDSIDAIIEKIFGDNEEEEDDE